MFSMKPHSIWFSIVLCITLLGWPIFGAAQSGYQNRISISLYQVGGHVLSAPPRSNHLHWQRATGIVVASGAARWISILRPRS